MFSRRYIIWVLTPWQIIQTRPSPQLPIQYACLHCTCTVVNLCYMYIWFLSPQYVRFCQWKYLELLTPYLVSIVHYEYITNLYCAVLANFNAVLVFQYSMYVIVHYCIFSFIFKCNSIHIHWLNYILYIAGFLNMVWHCMYACTLLDTYAYMCACVLLTDFSARFQHPPDHWSWRVWRGVWLS